MIAPATSFETEDLVEILQAMAANHDEVSGEEIEVDTDSTTYGDEVVVVTTPHGDTYYLTVRTEA